MVLEPQDELLTNIRRPSQPVRLEADPLTGTLRIAMERQPDLLSIFETDALATTDLIGSLDDIYDESALPDEVVLPGLLDHLLAEKPDPEQMESYLERAPQYFSKQIYNLCIQSREFEGLLGDHFDEIGPLYRMRSSGLESLILKFLLFKEIGQISAPITVPVVSFTFPHKECSVDSLFEHSTENEVAFKVDIPGVAGGKGRRRQAVLSTNTLKIKTNFQAHVKAEIVFRIFKKDDDVIALGEIHSISKHAFGIPESSPRFWSLPEPLEKYYHDTLGSEITDAESTKTTITIGKGSWAEFKLALTPGVLSSLSPVPLPAMPDFKIELSSHAKSLSLFKFGFGSPLGKLYDLKGATERSLWLYVEPEPTTQRRERTKKKSSRKKKN